MTEALLDVRNLRVQFGEFAALEAVSFELRAGETVGLVGVSGSGKSTLARALLRLIHSPSSSALGTSAATESITMTSRALERARVSQMLRASSPLSGWETSKSSRLTPSFLA